MAKQFTNQNPVMAYAMKIVRTPRLMARVVDTLTSATTVMVIDICAGTSAPCIASPAPVGVSHWIVYPLTTAAHHKTITAAMNMMKIFSLLNPSVKMAHLSANRMNVMVGVTTPTNTAQK